ncbi:TIGR03085 family metal-binding protein [Kitasatospora cinereorecta]
MPGVLVMRSIVPRRAGPSGCASTGRTAGAGRTLAGMSTHAKRERLLLADLLEAAGPEALTLCNGWKTRDLAAHVVVRERRADAAGGIVLGVLKNRLERVQAEFAAKPYEELIQLIRTGPPRMSPFGLKQLDEAANTVEFYIHAEDVRRAQPDWSRRELDPVFADVLWSRTEKTARMMGRRSPVGVVLRRPDGQTVVAHKGTPVVTVTGEPGELLLFAAGRQDAARVELDGDKDALARLRTAELGL